MSFPTHPERKAARLGLVEEHLRGENERDLGRIMATMGKSPVFNLNGEETPGRDGVRGLYEMLLRAFPDLRLEVKRRFVAEEAVVVELLFMGTQVAAFLGLPATGRRVEIPMCALFFFDDDEKVSGETVYFDAALLLRQLGLLPQAA